VAPVDYGSRLAAIPVVRPDLRGKTWPRPLKTSWPAALSQKMAASYGNERLVNGRE
jgi:hypothetical protein